MTTELTRFKDFQPSALDSKDNYISWDQEAENNIAEWFVGPIKTRDANIREQSNFDCILRDLGGEGDNVQVNGYGHWAVGHYDIIVVRPDTKQAEILQQAAKALEDYPIYDEGHYEAATYDANIENIMIELPDDLITKKSQKEVAIDVFRWIIDNDLDVENEACCPAVEDIAKALEACDYFSKSDEQQKHLDKLFSEIYPDDCCCEQCRNKRLENQDYITK